MSETTEPTTADKLKSYIERIERLSDEIDDLKVDLKAVKDEAGDEGFNVSALIKLVAMRRDKRKADRESEMMNDIVLYAHTAGVQLGFAFGPHETGE